MYYQECEHLANNYPGLKTIIYKIDEIIQSRGPGAVLDPEPLPNILREKESQTFGILKNLEKFGLLRKEIMARCPQCRNLMPLAEFNEAVEDEDEYTCSQCGLDIVKSGCEEASIYRITAKQQPPSNNDKSRKYKSSEKEDSPMKQELSKNFLENIYYHTPLLQYYSRDPDLQAEIPFRGKRSIIILHFLRDLIPFMEALFSLGLEPQKTILFYKAYPYPQKESVKKWIEEKGCQVLPIASLDTCLEELDKTPQGTLGEIIIIEDGGYCVPRIHKHYSNLLNSTIGVVEQTTRGIMNAKDLLDSGEVKKIRMPILSVAGSNLKAKFEPLYIAKAVISNISRMLPNMSWAGKEVGVFGYGSIGQKLCEWLLRSDSNVTVCEPSGEKALMAHQKGGIRFVRNANQAAADKAVVIGTSGRQSINKDIIPYLKHNVYIVSASSDQYEIDQNELRRLANHEASLYNEQG